MFSDPAFATTSDEHIVPDMATNNLIASLLSLLDLARTEIERDAEKAKLAIGRASSILRIERERYTGRMARDTSLGALTAWQVSRIRNYIDEHLSERILVKDLSAVALRSKAHFCRTFKSTMGETPRSYITRRRLDRAQSMMLSSDVPLCEVALQCGFSDQAHFCHRFRNATGQSPSAWRRGRLKVSGEGAVDTSSAITV
jgi:AraC-like DNA-binding protein